MTPGWLEDRWEFFEMGVSQEQMSYGAAMALRQLKDDLFKKVRDNEQLECEKSTLIDLLNITDQHIDHAQSAVATATMTHSDGQRFDGHMNCARDCLMELRVQFGLAKKESA